MPKPNIKVISETPELQLNISVDNKFLQFCKRFRITMRCLVFIQYFTVAELIRLKLVHSQLNQIINQDVLDMAIQIGNLDEIERELYWKSKINNPPGNDVYGRCPTNMIKFIKQSHDSTLQLMKITLETNVPGIIDVNDEILNKIITHLFVDMELYRIYEKSRM
jgi:hypothetical protein